MLDIRVLGLEQAIRALIAGEELDVGASQGYVLDEDARQALHFFYANKDDYLYKTPHKGTAAEQLVSWMQEEHEVVDVGPIVKAEEKKFYRLKKAVFHLIGGMHPFRLACGEFPDPIEINCEKNIFLAQGDNGVGKSRLANMLTFALTGKIPRDSSDAVPWNDPDLQKSYRIFGHDGDCKLPSFVPMPDKNQWEQACEKPDPFFRSGIELTLERIDGDNAEEVVVSRFIKRKKASDGDEEELSLDGEVIGPNQLAVRLGVSEVSLELCALHLARLRQIRFGVKEPLESRVAELTGLRPLANMLETGSGNKGSVQKFIDNLDNGTLLKKWRGTGSGKGLYGLKQINERFSEVVTACEKDCEDKGVSFSFPLAPIEVDAGDACQKGLEGLKVELEKEEENIKQAVSKSSGLEISAELGTLAQSAERLIHKLSYEQVHGQGFPFFIQQCEEMEDETIEEIRDHFDQTVDEVNIFAERVSDVKTAARRRLYAKVAGWFTEENSGDTKIEDCPVCFRTLGDGVLDAELDMSVQEALEEAKTCQDLEKTLADFAKGKFKEIADTMLPLSKDWKDLYHHKVEEQSAISLLSTGIFHYVEQNAVENLKPIIEKQADVFAASLEDLPTIKTDLITFHDDVPKALQEACQRLSGLITLIGWAKETKDNRVSVFDQVYGERLDEQEVEGQDKTISPECLVQQLDELVTLIRNNYDVLKRLKENYKGLEKYKKEWDETYELVAAAPAVVDALRKLLKLKQDVVDAQVAGLMDKLAVRTQVHFENLYTMHASLHPKMFGIQHDGKGLALTAYVHGTSGDALDITNSSRLRVYLFSFLYALAEHVWSESGGIQVMTMDDPQVLFDEDNQKNLAKGIVSFGKDGFQALVFTLDKAFASYVARAGKQNINDAVSPHVERMKIQPRITAEGNATLQIHSDMLRAARQAYTTNQVDQKNIVDLCVATRKYLEQTLVSFLRYGRKTVTGSDTLQPLLNALVPLVKAENSPFNDKNFKGFIGLLPTGEEDEKTVLFQQAINWAAHCRDEDLTPYHAIEVNNRLDKIIRCHNACDEVLFNAYERPVPQQVQEVETMEEQPPVVVDFTRTQPPQIQISEVGQVAAADIEQNADAGSSSGQGNDLRIEVEELNTFVLGAAHTKSLPSYVPKGAVIFADSDPATLLKDGDFVIARCAAENRIGIGRRYLKNDKGVVVIQGFGDMKPLVFDRSTTSLFRFHGGIYADVSDVPLSPLEQQDCSTALADRYQICTITSGHSAEPFLEADDRIFIDGQSLENEQLEKANDLIAVVYLENGESQLKRLNRTSVPGCVSYAPLGAHGEAGLFAFGEGAPGGISRIQQAYEMKGFWKGSSSLLENIDENKEE